jgi:hypothetical protein
VVVVVVEMVEVEDDVGVALTKEDAAEEDARRVLLLGKIIAVAALLAVFCC